MRVVHEIDLSVIETAILGILGLPHRGAKPVVVQFKLPAKRRNEVCAMEIEYSSYHHHAWRT